MRPYCGRQGPVTVDISSCTGRIFYKQLQSSVALKSSLTNAFLKADTKSKMLLAYFFAVGNGGFGVRAAKAHDYCIYFFDEKTNAQFETKRTVVFFKFFEH